MTNASSTFRARLAAMTPAEQDAALGRLLEAIEQSDDEIAAEIEAMSDEEIAAELRADGIDPEAWAAEVRTKMLRWCQEARSVKVRARTGRKRTRRLWRKRGRR